MLQEATKAINSAFNNSFIKKSSQYLHDCVREEVKSSTFRNLKGDKDNKWIFLKGEEQLFSNFQEYIPLDGADPKLTELMLQSEHGSRDKYLIYGYLFLVGRNAKSGKKNEFLTPLLYMPCRLERNGVNINCFPMDEVLSLNTGALAALMRKNDDEDEVDILLEGILNEVPDLPITQEKLDIFLTTLKSLIPEIEITSNKADYVDEDNITKAAKEFYADEKITAENVDAVVEEEENTQKSAVKLDKVSVTYQSAIILTKRPSVTAGVLHELTQIAEKPSGIYRETALSIINEEYAQSKEKSVPLQDIKNITDFYPVTPLSLSDSQEMVIKSIDNSKFVAVQGPPGTGKSQTIVNLVSHLVANGKTVLVASRMDKAVDVVADRLNGLGAKYMALRAGRLNYQRQLSDELNNLLSDDSILDEDLEDSIFATVDDMKDHLDYIKEIEGKCEKIIKLEREWYDQNLVVEEQEEIIGKMQFIKSSLSKLDIETLKLISKTLEKNLEKMGIIAKILNFFSEMKLKKTLKMKSFDVTLENLTRLNEELDFEALLNQLRKIETEIQKTGNLHQLTAHIKKKKVEQRTLATNILKNARRESLKSLLFDENQEAPSKNSRKSTHRKQKTYSRYNSCGRRFQTAIGRVPLLVRNDLCCF